MVNKINLDSISIGSDPEFFVFNPETGLHEVAIGMVNGTKEFPEPISDKEHYIQVDGVALEGNIPACKTSKDFIYNINWLKNWIEETLLQPKGLVISQKSTVNFRDEDVFHPKANEIGCEPSLDPYTLMFNAQSKYKDNWRAVAGHIHIGYSNPSEGLTIHLMKVLDLFLGVPSVLLDSDTKRRKLYGKAGDMRLKPWGGEYRTLSNFWCFDDVLMKWVFDNVTKAAEFINIGGIITNEGDIINAINNYDCLLALDILEDYKISLPQGYDVNKLIK